MGLNYTCKSFIKLNPHVIGLIINPTTPRQYQHPTCILEAKACEFLTLDCKEMRPLQEVLIFFAYFFVLLYFWQLYEAKQLMTDWLQLIAELSLQRDKLAALASHHNEMEWVKEINRAQTLKVSN